MPERNNREEIERLLPDEHREFVDGLWDKYDVPRDGLPGGGGSRFVRSEESARRQVEVVLESDVSVFALGVGSPMDVITAAKDRGKTLISLVGQPRHAERALAAGTDILVAQGHDAGAHTGPIGTFSLVPQIAAMADVPVLAAGGVATGRHIAAALALGAVGVWIGTAWLLTEEAHLEEQAVRQLEGARSADTVITRSDSGKTLRVVRSAWTDEWEDEDAPVPLQMPLQDILVGDLLGSIQRNKVEELAHHPAGQGIAWFNQLSTVDDVMSGLVDEASEVLEGLPG